MSGGIAEVCGSANAVDAALSVSSHANAVVVQDAKVVPADRIELTQNNSVSFRGHSAYHASASPAAPAAS